MVKRPVTPGEVAPCRRAASITTFMPVAFSNASRTDASCASRNVEGFHRGSIGRLGRLSADPRRATPGGWAGGVGGRAATDDRSRGQERTDGHPAGTVGAPIGWRWVSCAPCGGDCEWNEKTEMGGYSSTASKTGEAFRRGFDKIGQPDGHAPRV